jgi:deoxyribodipyrimidine photolyase
LAGSHAGDPRKPSYTLQQFESAATHDPLWNAARNVRVKEYLRRYGPD